jgi:glycosyltransferase involved in cell wall biosynthesis
MAKLVAMLRIKDGVFFLKDWLDRYELLVDEIVALDNGSTDGTIEMLRAHPKVVDIVHTIGYNEGRDKNLLYGRVRLRNPDWCLWLDVDEIFESGVTREVLDKLMANNVVDRFVFRRFHFADSEHFAASWYWLNYSAGHDRMLFREKPTGYFADLIIDSPNVKGIGGIKVYTNLRLKHLGYINKDLVDKKAAVYRTVLKGNQSVIGTMYVDKVKKMRWVDSKADLKVSLLNIFLNTLLLRQFCYKGVKLLIKPVKSVIEKNRSINVTPLIGTNSFQNINEQNNKNIQV